MNIQYNYKLFPEHFDLDFSCFMNKNMITI